MHITGFGEFYGVKHNPTTELVESLDEMLVNHPIAGLHIASKRVVKVSIEDCDEALHDIYTQIKTQFKEKPTFAKKYMVLNLGVHSGSKQFCLEVQGANEKNFRCPDMRGNNPCKETINTEKDL